VLEPIEYIIDLPLSQLTNILSEGAFNSVHFHNLQTCTCLNAIRLNILDCWYDDISLTLDPSHFVNAIISG